MDESALWGALQRQISILQSLTDSLSGGVVMTDEWGNFLLWNAAAERILDLKPVEFSPEQWSSQYGLCLPDKVSPFPPDQLPLVRALRGEVAADVEVFMRYSRQAGGAHLVMSARPFYLEGEFRGAIVALSDDTSHKKNAEILAALCFDLQCKEEMFRTLVTNIPGAIYRADPVGQHRTRFITGRISDITGHAAEKFMREPEFFSSRIHPEDCEMVYRELEVAIREKRAYVMEYRMLHSDGGTRWVYDKGQAVCGEDGRLLWFDCVLFDVTGRKDAEGLALRKTAELVRSDTEREQLKLFAFIASHDLRDPLQKISCFSDLVRMDCPTLDEKSRYSLDRIQATCQRMGQLLDDILQFTKAATHEAPMAPVNLNDVLPEVLSDLEVRLTKTGARVDIGKLPALTADRVQLRQLFQNLIGNAVKFVKKDVTPHVTVYGEASEDGFAVISVRDNGIGFDPSEAEKIFKPFERLNGKEDYEGSGLGLAICKKIVDRHGGFISVSSAPGSGSTFTVKLPLQRTA